MVKPISTFGQTALRNSQLRRLESDLAIANQEIATGKKDDVAKSIGSELINLQTIRNQFQENNAYIQSIELYKQRYELIDGGLAEAEAGLEELIQVGALNAAEALDSAGSVQLVADSVIDRVVTALNVQIGGRFLLGGDQVSNEPLQAADIVGAVSGLSPRQVINEAITGTGPVAPLNTGVDLTAANTFADVETLLDRFDDIFQGTNAAAAPPLDDYSFENTFYNGEIGGLITEVRLPTNQYDTQSNAQLVQGLRDVLQGAWILASVDLESITDDESYQRLMTGEVPAPPSPNAGAPARQGALDLISSGLNAIQQTRANLGLQYQIIDAAEEAARAQNAVFNNEIVRLENADPFETQSRFLDIEKQLEASYAASARVFELTFFNFVR